MGPFRTLARRGFIIAGIAVSLVAATSLAQMTTPVVTPGIGTLVPGHVPMATTNNHTITDLGSVPAHNFLGNNGISSAESSFVRPNQVDIDPSAASSSSSTYSIPSTIRSVSVAGAFAANTIWTLPAASTVLDGQAIVIHDPGNYVTPNYPLTLAVTTGDKLNGVLNNTITAGSPGFYVVATSDGANNNWHVEVISPPANSLDFQQNFGGVPISIQGDTNCQLSTSGPPYHVTNCHHTWTNSEAALVGSNFKFIAQYAGDSNAELDTYITNVDVGNTDFWIAAAPSVSGGGISSLQSVLVANSGSGYNFGSTICLDSGSTMALTRGCVTTSDLTVSSATVSSTGSGGTDGTYTCSLAAPLANRFAGVGSYAIAGVQATFTGTVSMGSLTTLAVLNGANYLALRGYTYDSGGAFDNVPVICPGSGLPTGISANVKFGLVTVQNGAGRTATDGVYTDVSWCSGAGQYSTTDHGAGATFTCSPEPSHVWAYYDNLPNLENAEMYLGGLEPSQRPCVKVRAVFGTSPLPISWKWNGGTPRMTGRECWKGEEIYATGFFMPSVGDTFPILDSAENASGNANGSAVTDAKPDESGTFFENLTFWGDPTAATSPDQGNCAIRFYGLSGRWLISNVTVDRWPGCLVGVGADAHTGRHADSGTLAEGVLIDTRSAFSGDSASRTPVIGCDAVGVNVAGCNNVTSIRHRAFDDFYASIRVTACNGGGGNNNASHDSFIGPKIEQSGMNQYNAASHEVVINDPDCTSIAFPVADGSTPIEGSPASGANDIKIVESALSNAATATYAAFVGGLGTGGSPDVNGIVIQGYINGGGAVGGGGIQFNDCAASCVANLTKNNNPDFGLLATAWPNSGTIAAGSILYDGNGQPLLSQSVDSGLTIGCSQGLGTISSSGACALVPMLANTLKGNPTGSTATPRDISVPSCSGASSALQWISGTGPNCATMETRQTMGSYCDAQQATNVTAYYGLLGSCIAGAPETSVNTFIALSGTFRNLGCVLDTAPGPGQSVTCSLRIAGASPPGHPSCTISGSATSCTDPTDTATLSAGGSADFKVTSNGAAPTRVFPYIEFDNP